MVDRELPTKFGLDPSSGFRETWVYGRMDRWTTDACATTVALLTKSSRAKNESQANGMGQWSNTYLVVHSLLTEP